jgi:uncharacterized Zn-binding protein involved in type VI secretion
MSDYDLFGGGGSDPQAGKGTRIIHTRVVDNCDDARLGRVMVQIPWLEGPVVATVATLAAGKGRGVFFTPQKDDEVLVVVKEQPDLTAYIIGCIHTSRDTPPESVRQKPSPDVQVIRTPGEHEVQFNDGTGELTISTGSGQTVKLSKDGVEIRGAEGDPESGVATIKLGADGAVTISGTSITLKADTVDIQATKGNCSITGTNIFLNGGNEMGQPAARIGSVSNPPHQGILTGSGARSVLIGNLPAAVAGDPSMTTHQCNAPTTPPHPPLPIQMGSATVFFEKRPAARVTDSTTCGASIISGAFDVLVGG